MRTRLWRRLAVTTTLAALVGGVLQLVPVPAGASLTYPTQLEVIRDVTTTAIGDSASLTAEFKDVNPITGVAAPVAVSFDTESFNGSALNTSNNPSAQCVVQVGKTSCTATGFTSAVPGTMLIRAWIDVDASGTLVNNGDGTFSPQNPPSGGSVDEADVAEGRYAGATDCPADDPSANGQTFSAPPCQTNQTAVPGAAEPDNTDVVEVDFQAAPVKLGCADAQGQRTIHALFDTSKAAGSQGSDVAITCKVEDANGNPLANFAVDGENAGNADGSTANNGANDPDGAGGSSSQDGYSDYTPATPPGSINDGDFCVTGADGTCTGTIPGNNGNGLSQQGPAYICFWIDGNGDDAYAPGSGNSAYDGANCGATQVSNGAFDNDKTDGVLISWETPHPAALQVAPNSTTPSTTGSVSYVATMFDQFGQSSTMGNMAVHGEYFSGSISDSDGNTPGGGSTDIFGCTTSSSGSCTVPPRSQANPGVDTACWWGGSSPAVPTMSGTATGTGGSAPTCTAGNSTSPTAITKVTWTTPPPPPPPVRSGYWLVDGRGVVYGFGDANPMGSAPVGSATAVDIESTPTGNGYWILDNVGHVFGYGDAKWLGNATLNAGERATSMSANPIGGGYWVFTDKGRAINFGTSPFFGDMSGRPLNGPVIGSVATPSGNGYFMVASDGGIFAFGDAKFDGSMGGKPLNKPVVGLVPDPDGVGYWLDAADGGVFSFDAPFRGSMGGKPLNQPVIGMVSYGNGYLMVASDGGVFDFSDKPFSGSLGSNPPSSPVTNIAAMPK